MRPALQILLRNPSALTILRDAIVCPENVFACRVSPRRNQSFSPSATKDEKDTQAVGGVSARVLSYITEEFKRRRQAAKPGLRRESKLDLGHGRRLRTPQKYDRALAQRQWLASVEKRGEQMGQAGEAVIIRTKPATSKSKTTTDYTRLTDGRMGFDVDKQDTPLKDKRQNSNNAHAEEGHHQGLNAPALAAYALPASRNQYEYLKVDAEVSHVNDEGWQGGRLSNEEDWERDITGEPIELRKEDTVDHSAEFWISILHDLESIESYRSSHLRRRDSRSEELKQIPRKFEAWLRSAQSRLLISKSNYFLFRWRQLRRHTQDLPTDGPLGNEVWEKLLRFAFAKPKHLREVISYAVSLQQRTGRVWKYLYNMVILHLLKRRDNDILRLYGALNSMMQPTRERFLSLVKHAHERDPQSAVKLQQIYKQLSFRDIYVPVIHHLYQEEKFMAAASWHDVFIACKDIPGDPKYYRLLFKYMALYGSQKRLASMVRNMVDQQVPLPTFIRQPMHSNLVSREVVDQQLAVTHGIMAKPISDNFYARLFATSWFSTDTVINILQVLGTQSVGSDSLRELALKERSDARTIHARIKQLRDAGIALSDTTFCKLIKRLCHEDNNRLLENVTNCDLHPDTFEDQNLQESLLGNYYTTGQQLQFDRTLAILLAGCPEPYHPSHYYNLHLRLYLKAKDLPAVTQTLQMMQASHLPLDVKSAHYFRICLFTRRRAGMRPCTTKELFLVINIWQNFLRSGGTMPAYAWVEILRRLGMTGQLEEYERLALWLADWYSSSPARAYLGGIMAPSVSIMQQFGRAVDIPKRIQPRHPRHPLHVLFPLAAQQSIVAWGFQHSRMGGPGWRWGLYMLLKLKQSNVHIVRTAVARACELRLIALFGKGRSSRMINRRERARNAAQLDYYVQEIEKIGGKGLIRPYEWKKLELDAQETAGHEGGESRGLE